MHMADALLSPTVGAVMWSATIAATAYSARKVQGQIDNRKIPLMGAIGAFVFAAQMINFAIPGTGSSGHLGGGLLLAILLGPHAAFLTMGSVLTVQALFFADGGLLALGANIFNLSFIPCYIGYPLIYKTIINDRPVQKRIVAGSVFAALVALQFGSLAVVLQTHFSNITALPFTSFLLLMQPIHLAIGLVEGFATAGIVTFLWKMRPEIIDEAVGTQKNSNFPVKNIAIGMLITALFTGGVLSWFSSGQPDGLEWSIDNVAGKADLLPNGKTKQTLDTIQNNISFMPDYDFKGHASDPSVESSSLRNKGTSISGIIGGLLVLCCSILVGFLLKKTTRIS
jgi:cobalt/nickel transport system permease protein